ncbi:thiol-disulfide oxidoreductase DCC family protein [Nisaea denitrificans]|uniref:thiol-disulfide oxidoreductase DCC family protein n=1 Tax=Nisaea denitrificans TaxID=390877 RepID=UPI00048F1BC9|nr:DUF393 domain-containing protein [Nisaea denitrificans]
MADTESRTVVFFDGSCPLCQSEIHMYRQHDVQGALCLVDVSDSNAVMPPALDRETAMKRFHIIAKDGQIHSGAAAFVEVWRQLPGWRWGARIASLPGLTPLLECGYRLFLPIRPWLAQMFQRVGDLIRKD